MYQFPIKRHGAAINRTLVLWRDGDAWKAHVTCPPAPSFNDRFMNVIVPEAVAPIDIPGAVAHAEVPSPDKAARDLLELAKDHSIVKQECYL